MTTLNTNFGGLPQSNNNQFTNLRDFNNLNSRANIRQKQTKSKNKRVKIDRKLITSHDLNGLSFNDVNNIEEIVN